MMIREIIDLLKEIRTSHLAVNAEEPRIDGFFIDWGIENEIMMFVHLNEAQCVKHHVDEGIYEIVTTVSSKKSLT